VEGAGQGRGRLLEIRSVEVVGRHLDLQIQRRAQHAHFHVEPLPGAAALEQGAEDAQGEEGGPVLIDHRGAHRRGRLVRAPGDVGQAGEGLHEEVLPGPVAIRAALAVARGRDVDEPRVERAGRLPVQPEAGHDARAEVLHEDIGALDEPARDGLAAGLLEIQGEAPLVAVGEEEEDADAVEEEVGAGPVALPEPSARRLDLDHVGPEVGEELHRGGAQEELSEADHAHVFQNRQRRAGVRQEITRRPS
jgi:hypothetical protein